MNYASVVANLEISGVDEGDHHGQGLGVQVLNEDLVLLGFLHVAENHGSQHRRPEVEHI